MNNTITIIIALAILSAPFAIMIIASCLASAHKRHWTICSWCQGTIHTGRLPVSHGICPECERTQQREIESMRVHRVHPVHHVHTPNN